MRRIACFLLLLALFTTGCGSSRKKREKEKPAAQTKQEKGKPPEESSDQDFAAFVGRLRKAVQARDMKTLAEMMTTVFAYEDEHGLWPELQGIVDEKFVKKDDYMVAPPQFANSALEYEGYRAGVR